MLRASYCLDGCAVSGRKSGRTPLSTSFCLAMRLQSNSLRLSEKVLCRNATNLSASTDKVSAFQLVLTGPKMVIPVTGVLKTVTGAMIVFQRKSKKRVEPGGFSSCCP